MSDLYRVLGVSKGASKKEIKRAYRKLAAELHPDKNNGKEERFKEVTGAYEVLGDEKKRKLYDEFGDLALRSGFDENAARAARGFGGIGGLGGSPQGVQFDFGESFSQGGGLGDILGDLFGGSRGRGRRSSVGHDATSKVSISFADSIRGTTIKLAPTDGSDAMTVRIPAGTEHGCRVRVRGKGSPGQFGPPGDLLLEIDVRPHKYFRREGDDLHLDLPITIGEAYRGAQVPVPTPGGEVKLTVPAGTQSGQKLRLRGKGVHRRRRTPGDLYVRFLVTYPTGEELGATIDELAKHSENPRDGIKL